MIKRHEMLPILVEACPSFSEKWREHKLQFHDEEDYLPYIALAELNNHLVDLYRENKTSDFEKVFEVIERLHIDGDDYVKEAATIGLLEGIQNIAGNQDLDPEVFYVYLKPVSAIWWNDLNKFWNGETDFVGKTLDAKS